MKLILLFFFITFSFFIPKGHSQVFQDSLAQFSYMLYGSTALNKQNQPTKVQGRQATGVFIKRNERIYFVTAKHAVTNHITENEKKNEFPENYNVYSHYSDPFNFIPVPPILVSDKVKIKEGLRSSDIFSYEVTNKLNGFPISILRLPENHTDFIPISKEPAEIRFFGFPGNMNRVLNEVIQVTPPYLFSTKKFTISENFINQIGNEIGIDSFRYEIQIKDSRVNSGLSGFSGAPVFIRTGSTNEWEFLGILVGINPLKNSIYVVKRDRILVK